MSKQLVSAAALFIGAAVLGGLTLHPSSSEAAWRMYPATLCEVANDVGGNITAPRLTRSGGSIINKMFSNQSLYVALQCPIVEDGNEYAKGGTTYYVTTTEVAGNNPSRFQACSGFDGTFGGTCDAMRYPPLSPGTHTSAYTPAASQWSSGKGFGYIYVELGSMAPTATFANSFNGYWLQT